MNRRDAIKTISLLGVGMILPIGMLAKEQAKRPNHFIGLGSAGSRMVEHLYNKGVRGRFTCVDDKRNPELPSDVGFIRFIAPEPDKILFGHKFYEVSDIQKDWGVPLEIKTLVDGDEKFVILAGLGRFTGSYLSVQLSGLLSGESKNHIMVNTLPFSFEGEGINEIAKYAHKRIRSHSKTFTYNLNEICDELSNIVIREAFMQADNVLGRIISGY